MKVQLVHGALERTEQIMDLLARSHDLTVTAEVDRVKGTDAEVIVWPEDPLGRHGAAALVGSLDPRTTLAVIPVELTGDRLGLAETGIRYVVDPFHPMELVRRVELLAGSAERQGRVMWAGDLMVDEGAREVTRSGQPLQLTLREFDLLAHLVTHRGQVQDRPTLLRSVWSSTDYSDSVIEVTVSTLRRKLEAFGPRIVHTVRGIGYVCRVDEASTETLAIVAGQRQSLLEERRRVLGRRDALIEQSRTQRAIGQKERGTA